MSEGRGEGDHVIVKRGGVMGGEWKDRYERIPCFSVFVIFSC